MKIAVIGVGKAAQVLGKGLHSKGYKIVIGCRDINSENLKYWKESVDYELDVVSIPKAVNMAETIIIAINPYSEIEKVINNVPKEYFQNKTVIDISNNIIFENPVRLSFTNQSMGEFIQSLIPNGNVVKTLNITPAYLMVNPLDGGLNPAIMWLSGNHAVSKRKVQLLLTDLGWEQVVDIGDITKSKLQESIGLLLTKVIFELTANK